MCSLPCQPTFEASRSSEWLSRKVHGDAWKFGKPAVVSLLLRWRNTGSRIILRGSRRTSEDRGGHRGKKAAASSVVPMLLSPISLRNYSASCGSEAAETVREVLMSGTTSERLHLLVDNVSPFLDSQKKPYIHLVDGGVADNLGVRALLDRVLIEGSFWETIKGTPMENAHKVVFIVVNAETQPDTKWDTSEAMPDTSAMMSAYSSIAIERYNNETISLLRERVLSWAGDIKDQRCRRGEVSTAPGS